MFEVGAMFKCNMCGKEEFLKRTKHSQSSGGWGCCEKFDKSTGWVYKSKIGDICPDCAEKMRSEISSKYNIDEDIVKCYLENYQYVHTCQHDARKCPNYNKCVEIFKGEGHGSSHM